MFTANIIVISSIFKANNLMNDNLHFDRCFIPLQHSFSRTTNQAYIIIFTAT